MFTPTGFNLAKKEIHVKSIMVLYNTAAYGITDHFSVGVGMVSWQAPLLNARISSSDLFEYLHLSGGIMGYISENERGIGGHIAASFGTPDYFVNVSKSKNFGWVEEEDRDLQGTSFGGSFRVGNRKRIFAEYVHLDESQQRNYFRAYPEQKIFLTFGMAIFNSTDSYSLGLLVSHTEGGRSRVLPAFTADFLIQKKKR